MVFDRVDKFLDTYFGLYRPWFLGNSAIKNLCTNDVKDCSIQPREYLAAAHEVLALTIVISWGVTLVWYRYQILTHPALAIIGSVNPCFGWDYPPASYIASTMSCWMSFYCWRYTLLQSCRIRLLNPGTMSCAEYFSLATSRLLALSSTTWLLLWQIGPAQQQPGAETANVPLWAIHTGFFFFFAAAGYLAYIGKLVEVKYDTDAKPIHWLTVAHAAFYGLSTVYLFGIYAYNLVTAHTNGHEHQPLPMVLGYIADWTWIVCVIFVPSFLPAQPPVRIQCSINYSNDPEYAELKRRRPDEPDESPRS